MEAEWETRLVEYPRPEYNCLLTSISFGSLSASYWHVDGGFKVDRNHKRSRLYTSETEIRQLLLQRLLAEARKAARQIKAASDATFFASNSERSSPISGRP